MGNPEDRTAWDRSSTEARVKQLARDVRFRAREYAERAALWKRWNLYLGLPLAIVVPTGSLALVQKSAIGGGVVAIAGIILAAIWKTLNVEEERRAYTIAAADFESLKSRVESFQKRIGEPELERVPATAMLDRLEEDFQELIKKSPLPTKQAPRLARRNQAIIVGASSLALLLSAVTGSLLVRQYFKANGANTSIATATATSAALGLPPASIPSSLPAAAAFTPTAPGALPTSAPGTARQSSPTPVPTQIAEGAPTATRLPTATRVPPSRTGPEEIRYDFYTQASRAQWVTANGAIPFTSDFTPQSRNPRGMATRLEQCAILGQLEDGTAPEHCLLTDPNWDDSNYIFGTFETPDLHMDDYFVALVGFPAGTIGAEVTFAVEFVPSDGRGVVPISSIQHAYIGQMQQIDVQIPTHARGIAGRVRLRVEATASAANAQAVWVEPRLVRRPAAQAGLP